MVEEVGYVVEMGESGNVRRTIITCRLCVNHMPMLQSGE